MKHLFKTLSALLLLLFVHTHSFAADKITVAAAANLRYVLEELKQQYVKSHKGTQIDIVFVVVELDTRVFSFNNLKHFVYWHHFAFFPRIAVERHKLYKTHFNGIVVREHCQRKKLIVVHPSHNHRIEFHFKP